MQKSQTFRLNSRNGILFLAFFGAFWTLCSLTSFVPGLLSQEPLAILFGCLFMVPGLLMLGYASSVYYSRARLGRPEVLISNTTLCVGETFSLTLMHTFKRDVQLDKIQVQLVFRETATYQQGTDTRTVTHNEVVEHYELPGGHYRAGHSLQEAYTMQIPADGMHTLNVRRNQLQWFVRVEAAVPKLPDYVDEYELTVLPELAVKEDSHGKSRL